MRIVFPVSVALALAFAGQALAQTSPGFSTGQVPSAPQWNGYFSGKLDDVAPSALVRGGVFAQPGYVDATGLGSAANVNMGASGLTQCLLNSTYCTWTATPSYTPTPPNIQAGIVEGSLASPVSTLDPPFFVQKFTSGGVGLNPAFTVSNTKQTTAPGTAAQGFLAEVWDPVGWNGVGSNNFIEGARFHAWITGAATNGSGYGLVTVAGQVGATSTWHLLFGHESDLYNNTQARPPAPGFTANIGAMTGAVAAAYNASNSGAYPADAAYLVNPWAASKFITGFRSNASVSDTAFYDDGAKHVGLYLNGSYDTAAILLANGQQIMGENTAGTGQVSIGYIEPTSDRVVLGNGASQTFIASPAYAGGLITFGGGAKAIAVAIASLPTCNSTTVGTQLWVNNGIASPTYHQSVSTTGGATWPVYCIYNGSTYSWVY